VLQAGSRDARVTDGECSAEALSCRGDCGIVVEEASNVPFLSREFAVDQFACGRHGDGAIARWRTLHEIAVIAMCVRDRGDAMAERYLLHSTVESYKALKL
jgi:hypothetical protein